jgi:hypothetical protein
MSYTICKWYCFYKFQFQLLIVSIKEWNWLVGGWSLYFVATIMSPANKDHLNFSFPIAVTFAFLVLWHWLWPLLQHSNKRISRHSCLIPGSLSTVVFVVVLSGWGSSLLSLVYSVLIMSGHWIFSNASFVPIKMIVWFFYSADRVNWFGIINLVFLEKVPQAHIYSSFYVPTDVLLRIFVCRLVRGSRF